MKIDPYLVLGVTLIAVSAVLAPHAYGSYLAARASLLSIDALSPAAPIQYVKREVVPLLPSEKAGDAARTALKSEQELASGLHKLNLSQAHALEQSSIVNGVAWVFVLLLGGALCGLSFR
jgi:hypothetical protein